MLVSCFKVYSSNKFVNIYFEALPRNLWKTFKMYNSSAEFTSHTDMLCRNISYRKWMIAAWVDQHFTEREHKRVEAIGCHCSFGIILISRNKLCYPMIKIFFRSVTRLVRNAAYVCALEACSTLNDCWRELITEKEHYKKELLPKETKASLLHIINHVVLKLYFTAEHWIGRGSTC